MQFTIRYSQSLCIMGLLLPDSGNHFGMWNCVYDECIYDDESCQHDMHGFLVDI